MLSPRSRSTLAIDALDLVFPFAGCWLTRNSPANRVPSHGTELFATAYAIDFVPVDRAGRTAPITLRSLTRREPAARFPGFGRPVLAPITGSVVAVHGQAPDHDAHRGLPSIGYALTQGRRAADGWLALAGNHVLVQGDHAVIALCHLQQGSVRVAPGDHVRAGDVLGACGNSGNSTEPHLHVQAIDRAEIEHAHAVPITFSGRLPRNGEIVVVD